jgi:molybdate transport system regulatory protein
MTPGNIPRLIEALRAQADDDERIACADAFRIARDLDVPLADVGRTCDELGIKVMQCQLGCF